jgi:hypothetical protein
MDINALRAKSQLSYTHTQRTLLSLLRDPLSLSFSRCAVAVLFATHDRGALFLVFRDPLHTAPIFYWFRRPLFERTPPLSGKIAQTFCV